MLGAGGVMSKVRLAGVRCWIVAGTTAATFAVAPGPALADQGGVSFWVPGLFGSLAAVPGQPGFNFASVFYHTSVGASGSVAAQKQIEIGQLRPRNLNLNVNLDVNLDARANLVFLLPGYTFETPIFGGQLWVGVATIAGKQTATLDGTLTASLGPLSVTRQGQISDSASGFADLFPQATLKWNHGVHNTMIYGMTNIQVGTYDSTRLANLGLGHSAIDGGLGYTYFDPTKGHEFSVVAGTTYNFENKHTNYRNGQDYHIDAAAAQFLSKTFFIGAVGYYYDQFTADSGSLPIFGEVKSRVLGIGPQMGFIIPMGEMQGFLNFKAYFESNARDRPDGWNTWVTFQISPAARPAMATTPSRMALK
jgi:hypothetical protein